MSSSRLLIFSLLFNSILIACMGLMILRLGGWKYALYRLNANEEGPYQHRKSLFKELSDKRDAIVFLGDSQIEQCEWRELLGDSLRIINRGIVGDHVKGVQMRLKEVMRHKPAKIILCIGINDLLFGTSLDDTEEAYKNLVQDIRKEAPTAQLILTGLPPVNNEVKRTGITNETIREMNARIGQIAREFALPMVDLYEKLASANGNLQERFTSDGIHLNGTGYLQWKRELAPYLKVDGRR
jgi:lysophospholipase L1-like esterase